MIGLVWFFRKIYVFRTHFVVELTPFYSFCAILQLLPASLFTISNMNESYENFKKSSRYVGYIPNAYFMELMNLSSKFTGLFFKARNLWSSLPDVCNLKIHEEFWMGISFSWWIINWCKKCVSDGLGVTVWCIRFVQWFKSKTVLFKYQFTTMICGWILLILVMLTH